MGNLVAHHRSFIANEKNLNKKYENPMKKILDGMLSLSYEAEYEIVNYQTKTTCYVPLLDDILKIYTFLFDALVNGYECIGIKFPNVFIEITK